MRYSLPEIVVFAIAAALPAYLIRFHIGPLPMTALEIVLLMGIVAMIVQITHPALSYNKRGAEFVPPLKIRGGRGRYDLFFGENKLLTIGSALILIATIVGIVVAPDKTSALGIAKAYFWEPMALAFLLIAAKPDKEKIRRACLYGFAASALVVVIYGLLQYTHPALIPATWTAERRITSVFDFPNAAALYLAPLVAPLLSSPITIALAFFSIIIIILAKSAGGLIAVAAALFFLGVTAKRTRAVTIIAAAIVASIVMFAPQGAGLREQILLRDWSGRVHQIGWKESFAMLRDHPLFGAGLDGYQIAVKPYHKAQGVEIFQYPHNLFLAIWSELGLLGLAGFALVLAWYFRKAIASSRPSPMTGEGAKARRVSKYLIAAMIAILVHGLVDVPYFKNDLATMFWLFIVLVAL